MFIAPVGLDPPARFGRVELNIESEALDPFHPSEPRVCSLIVELYKHSTPAGVKTTALAAYIRQKLSTLLAANVISQNRI